MLKQELSPDGVPDFYGDLLVLHVRVIEDHIDGSSPRRKLSHRWPVGGITHVLVAGSACVDGIGQQCAQAKDQSNTHQQMLQS